MRQAMHDVPGADEGAVQSFRRAVKRLLYERGMTQKELAARIGMGEGVLSHFLTGRRRRLTAGERRAIERELAADLAAPSWPPGDGVAASAPSQGRRLRLVPVYPVGAGYEIAFGDGDTPVGESLDDPVASDVPDPNAFAGRIVGSSMESPQGEVSFREGDIVVFDTKAEVRNGSFCLVRFVDDGSTFKQVFREGQTVRLHPLNPEFPDETCPVERIHAMYRAVTHVRRI